MFREAFFAVLTFVLLTGMWAAVDLKRTDPTWLTPERRGENQARADFAYERTMARLRMEDRQP